MWNYLFSGASWISWDKKMKLLHPLKYFIKSSYAIQNCKKRGQQIYKFCLNFENFHSLRFNELIKIQWNGWFFIIIWKYFSNVDCEHIVIKQDY